MVNDSARRIRTAVRRTRIRLITVRALHLGTHARHDSAIPPAVRKSPCLLTGVDDPSDDAHDGEPKDVRPIHSSDETGERHGNDNSPGEPRQGPDCGLDRHQVPIRIGTNHLRARAQTDLPPDPTPRQRDLPVDSGRVAQRLIGNVLGPRLIPPEVLREPDRSMPDDLLCYHLLGCRNVGLAH